MDSGSRRRADAVDAAPPRHGHEWGSLTVDPVDRNGQLSRFRLEVYPPGTSAAERAWLRLTAVLTRAAAPLVVCSLAAGAMIGAEGRGGPLSPLTPEARLALPILVIAELVALTIARRRTTRQRGGTVVLRGARARSPHGLEITGSYPALEEAATLLLEADEALAVGAIDHVAHEIVWERAWSLARDDPSSSAGRRRFGRTTPGT